MLLWPVVVSTEEHRQKEKLTTVREQLLPDNDVRVRLQGRDESIVPLLDRPLLLPRVESRIVELVLHGRVGGSPEQLVALRAWNVRVVPPRDERQPQPPLGQLDEPLDAVHRVPLVPDHALQQPDEERHLREGPEHGEHAANLVPAEHFGQRAEAGHEHDAPKLDPRRSVHLRDAAGHGGTEALAQQDDALRGDAALLHDEIDERRGVLDEAELGGRATRIAVAAVVDGEDVVG